MWVRLHGPVAHSVKGLTRRQSRFAPSEKVVLNGRDSPHLVGIRPYLGYHAAEFGLNSSRIGFMGFSAGGDLAAGISANFAVRAYDKIDSIDDVECRPDFALMVYPAVHAWADNITKDHPPSFLAQAENDPVSAELTTQYYLRLRNVSSASSDLHLFHGAIHGYGLCNVRDAEGRIAVLVAPPEGPGLMPAWAPWSSVCLWPHMAKAFLHDLGLLKTENAFVV